MFPPHRALPGLLLGALLANVVAAQTLEEDEARIEQLMSAPTAHPAPSPPAVPAVDDSVRETPVVAAVVAPAPSADDAWLAAPSEDAGLEFSALPKLVGQRVAVVMRQGKERIGTIVSADAKQVTLKIIRKGGSASYAIPREKIERVEGR